VGKDTAKKVQADIKGDDEMGLSLTKGSEGMFVELEQENVVKRFVIPAMEELEGKLQSFVKKHPGLILVRFGKAIVASQDGAAGLRDGLDNVPSAVVSSCMVDLCGGHPVLNIGPARYSLDLIKEINECETETVAQEEVEKGQLTIHDVPAPELPKPDLAASLRAQLQQKKEEPKVETLQDKLNAKLAEQKSKPVAEKSELILTTSEDLKLLKHEEQKGETPAQKATREYFANHKNAEIIVREGRSPSKIDMILMKLDNIEGLLGGDLESEMTGKDLAEWFWQHLENIGEEKTFSILASRLTK
jgi:hypothetical protein